MKPQPLLWPFGATAGRPSKKERKRKAPVKGRYGDGARCAEVQLKICQQPEFECIPRKTFDRCVRDMFQEVLQQLMASSMENGVERDISDFRLKPGACRLLQALTESYMTNLFLEASMVAVHAKRMTVDERDLRFLAALKQVNELDGMSWVSLEKSEPLEKRSRRRKRLRQQAEDCDQEEAPRSSEKVAPVKLEGRTLKRLRGKTALQRESACS
eukprot:Skav236617  [mRNA]  locus=scaffold1476:212992:214389:- [translate_table: standard]